MDARRFLARAGRPGLAVLCATGAHTHPSLPQLRALSRAESRAVERLSSFDASAWCAQAWASRPRARCAAPRPAPPRRHPRRRGPGLRTTLRSGSGGESRPSGTRLSSGWRRKRRAPWREGCGRPPQRPPPRTSRRPKTATSRRQRRCGWLRRRWSRRPTPWAAPCCPRDHPRALTRIRRRRRQRRHRTHSVSL